MPYENQYQQSDYRKLPGEDYGQYFRRVQGQQRANAKGRRDYENQAAYKKQRGEELAEFDAESGKFYDLMRQGFRERTQGISAAAQTQGLGALNQAASRAGIAFSGVQQAAQANLQGQLGASQLEAQSSYDQRLNELRQTSRDQFQAGQFDFFHSLQAMTQKYDLEKDFARFQADLADQYSSGWSDFFNVVGQGVGMWASGGFSGLFSAGAGVRSSGGAGGPYRR